MLDYQRKSIREVAGSARAAAVLLDHAANSTRYVYPLNELLESLAHISMELFQTAELMDAGLDLEVHEHEDH